MHKRRVRKMLRLMESGEPVQLTIALTTWKGLSRLAFVAEQFGYAYADLQQTSDHKFVLTVVPDPSPRAQERAALNRARYPDANDGVSLPPTVPDATELLKARMVFDLGRQLTDKQRVELAALVITLLTAANGLRFADGTAGVLITVGVWAGLMALLPVVSAASRRCNARSVAQLEAAGFTPVTDRGGQLRYVRPGGQLPGHGNPFAGGA